MRHLIIICLFISRLWKLW